MLSAAIPSSYTSVLFPSREAWQEAVRSSDVRLQWDPDHDPSGQPQDRRAIQLGLRGAALAEYAGAAILELNDITDFVVAERSNARSPFSDLQTPLESVLTPLDPKASAAIGLDAWSGPSGTSIEPEGLEG